MTLTPCAAQADLHGGLQAALIVDEVRQVVVDIWHLERFPVCQLLKQFLRLVWGRNTAGEVVKESYSTAAAGRWKENQKMPVKEE